MAYIDSNGEGCFWGRIKSKEEGEERKEKTFPGG